MNKNKKYKFCFMLVFIFIFITGTMVYLHNLNINPLDILQNHYYINLDHRKDRNESTIYELSKLGIHNPNRFEGVKHNKGSIGCQISHLNVLKDARERGLPYVTIFEDDILFLKPKETLEKLGRIINSDIEWDVILLGGNNFPPYQRINEDCIKVNNCQTRTAYLVKNSYYDTLINQWDNALEKLLVTKPGPEYESYRGDMSWKPLQRRDNFILITPVNVVQKPGYSDIVRKNVNYVNWMIDIK